MSIESIIGIVSGVLGILTAIITGVVHLKKYLKKTPPAELYNRITDKQITDAKRRKVLKQLNKSSVINHRIADEYIDQFTLNGRGRETLLFDICDKNNIEPTDDVCRNLIGASMPSLRKKYLDKRAATTE